MDLVYVDACTRQKVKPNSLVLMSASSSDEEGLVCLDLSRNYVGNGGGGFQAMLQLVETSAATLESIDISFSAIGFDSDATGRLFRTLTKARRLRKLVARNCALFLEGAQLLLSLLRSNRNIVDVVLMDDEDAEPSRHETKTSTDGRRLYENEIPPRWLRRIEMEMMWNRKMAADLTSHAKQLT